MGRRMLPRLIFSGNLPIFKIEENSNTTKFDPTEKEF